MTKKKPAKIKEPPKQKKKPVKEPDKPKRKKEIEDPPASPSKKKRVPGSGGKEIIDPRPNQRKIRLG